MSAPVVTTTPFQRAAVLYAELGWSPVPITPNNGTRKGVPVEGFTGQHGRIVTRQLAEALSNGFGATSHPNIAVRAVGVVGIDVDAYDDRDGVGTVKRAQAKLGELPKTWRSSARDAPSGIYWYRVPEAFDDRQFGGSDLGEFGENVEIVRWGHRFALVWPTVHPNGSLYRWYDQDDSIYEEGDIPDASALPELPEAWCTYLLGRGKTGGGQGWDGIDRSEVAPAGHSTRWREKILSQIGKPIPNGKHEATLWAFAMDLRQHGATLEEAHTLMSLRISDCVPAWNDGNPAMPADRFCAWQIGRAWRERQPPCDCDDIFCSDPHTQGREDRVVMRPFEDAMELYEGDPEPDPDFVEPVVHYIWPEDSGRDPSQRRRTYRPIDLWADHDGESVQPTILRRTDGAAGFYRGEVNGLIGPPESGKSLIALLASVQVIRDGGHVVYLDYERAPSTFRDRLSELWALTDEERSRFTYLAPDETFCDDQDRADLESVIDHADLVIVDAWTACLSVYGLSSNSGDDVRLLSRKLLHPLASKGAAVVVLDHVRKDDGTTAFKGGVGSQDKRGQLHGAQLKAAVQVPLAPGKGGVVALYIDKDTLGQVRKASTDDELWGTFRIEADTFVGLPEVCVRPPSSRVEPDMWDRITEVLEDGEFRNATWICKQVPGRDEAKRKLLKERAQTGELRSRPGAKGGTEYGL